MPIQKNIFQTVASYETLPSAYRENIETLKSLNPDWTHKLFNNDEQREYIRTHIGSADCDAVEKVNPKYGVVLADLFRYLAIYHEGGVYLDIKSTASRPLNDVIKDDSSYLISQWQNKIGQMYEGSGLFPDLADVPGGEFQQWHVIAEAGHPFLKAVVESVLENIRNYTPKRFGVSKMGVLRLSGPICYTKAIWPLMDHFPWTAVDVVDLGIKYSVFEDSSDKDRHTKFSGHYSKLKEPIVLKDLYVDHGSIETLGIGDLLANEIRENTPLVLKLAVAAFVAAATFVILFPLVVIWLLR